MKINKNSAKKSAVALMLLALGTTSASLAWRDVSQHKTNRFQTTSVANNVVLVENFQQKTNWKVGESVAKKVAVRNGQMSDDISSFTYEDGFVRLQFREFMEIGDQVYEYSQKRYMVNTSGNFVKFETLALAQAFVNNPANNIGNIERIEQVKSEFDDTRAPAGGYFYIATQEKDINGQYGKFLIINSKIDSNSSIEGTSGPAKGEPGVNHTQTGTPAEASWSVHKWDATNTDGYAKESPFTEYVKWEMGTNITTLKNWDGKSDAKWIIDTDSEQGWVYWGQALSHSQEAKVNESLTSNILESVSLVKQPESLAQYFINVKLDTVNRTDLNLWTDAPTNLLTVLGRSQISQNLRKTVDDSNVLLQTYSGIDSNEITRFNTILTSAKAILQDSSASDATLYNMYIDITESLEALKADTNTNLRIQLNQNVKKIDATDLSQKFESTVVGISDANTAAKALLVNKEATDAQITQSDSALKTAMSKVINKKVTLANREWNVWHVTALGEVYLTGKEFNLNDAVEMKLVENVEYRAGAEGSEISIKYLSKNQVDYGNSNASNKQNIRYYRYSLSNVRTVMDKYYNEVIKKYPEVDNAILSARVQDEERLAGNAWSTRTDKPARTIVNNPTAIHGNEFKVFLPGISDINHYDVTASIRGANGFESWLRSPAATNLNERNGALGRTGNVVHIELPKDSMKVTPAMFLDSTKIDLGAIN